MKVCIFDFETTGLDPLTAMPIEYGYVVYDFTLNRMVRAQSNLVFKDGMYPPIEPKIERLTHIDKEQLNPEYKEALTPHDMVLDLAETISDCQGVAGHNIRSYDLPILARFLKSDIDLELSSLLKFKVVIDTMTDLPLPLEFRRRDLVSLSAEHGFLNPFPHRALSDAMSCMKLMTLYPFGEILKLAKEEAVMLVPMDDVPLDNETLKGQSFIWKPEHGWCKSVKPSRLDLEMGECPFEYARAETLRLYEADVPYKDRDLAKQCKFRWEPDMRKWIKAMPELMAEKYLVKYGFNVKEIQPNVSR